MKKFAILVAFFAFAQCPIYSAELSKDEDKVYFDQEALKIVDNMIIVRTPDGIYSTSALFQDAQGLFSYPKDLSPMKGKYIHNGEFVDERLERVCPNGHRYAKCYYSVCPICKSRGNLAKKNDKDK